MSNVSTFPQPGTTVLVVDDNAGSRLLLTTQLRLEGYSILEAETGYDAIELARTYDPDIILLDVMMPQMNGFETCVQLKADPRTESIPVIMITALRDVRYRIKGIEAGAEEFLSRPHVREELIVRVRTLTQLKQARRRIMEERNRLQLLYNISQATNANLDLVTLVKQIITRTQAAVGAAKGSLIMLSQGESPPYRYTIRQGAANALRETLSPEVLERGLGSWVIATQRAAIIDNVSRDGRWISLHEDAHEANKGSAIAVPIGRSGSILGILILAHPDTGYFTTDHQSLLETISAQVTTAIENANLFASVDEERNKLTAVLAQTTDAIVIVSESWHVVLTNPATERLFDVAITAVTGKQLHQLAAFKPLLPLFEKARQAPAAEEVTLSDARTLFVSVSPITGVGYVAVMQDVTAAKAAEALRLDAERHEKKHVKDAFTRYLGSELAEHVLASQSGLAAQRTSRRAVVLYADLRNWTRGMMTKMEPDAVIEQLNEHFMHMMEVAQAHRGTVFELTGDEMLVAFNALFDQPDAAFLAVNTAVEMQRRFDRLRREWFRQYGTQVGLGIGIDRGQVVIGNVGTEYRMNFRMVGEVMSRAHRLVDIARDGEIVVSESIHDGLLEAHAEWLGEQGFRSLGALALKGIDHPYTVYSTYIAQSLANGRS